MMLRSSYEKKAFSEGGFLTISMIVASLIIAVLSVQIYQNYASVTKFRLTLEEKLERLALSRYLIQSVDCSLTEAGAPSPCADGTYVDVKSQSPGSPIIVKKYSMADPTNVSTIGAYSVRAKCGPSQSLVFEAKKTNFPTNEFEVLFREVPFGCVMP